MKAFAKSLCPPVLWQAAHQWRSRAAPSGLAIQSAKGPDLGVFADPNVVRLLEWWGEGNAWREIELVMAGRTGRVLDIGCGLAAGMKKLSDFPGLDVHGCDLSASLLDRAAASGIPRDHLKVVDATDMACYGDNAFDWGYSLGSLHYFTDADIEKCLRECFRVVSGPTFHQVPVDRQDRDMGWVRTFQSVQNNSIAWWADKCRAVYPQVHILDSIWADNLSIGKWLICAK